MEIIDRKFLDTPTRSSHAATIEFWKGHPVFAWFGGSREGAQDVAIYLNNLNGNNENIIIGSRDAMPRWNPILYAYNDKLWMFEKVGVFCDRWQTFIHNITDWDNKTPEKEIRSKCQTLPAGLNGPVKTKPIYSYLSEDHIYCGSSVETFCDWTSYIEEYEIINDIWELVNRSSPIAVKDKVAYRNPQTGKSGISLGIIQPAIWTNNYGMHSFFRSSSGLDKIYYSNSLDFVNWSDPIPTNLPNPNSGVDVVHIDDRLFLVSNPSSILRNPLVIQEIICDKNNFEIVDEIIIRESIDESDKGRCISQELSYPYMVENDGKLHLVYTYGRSRIEYVTVSI